jgi:hypothetical protein
LQLLHVQGPLLLEHGLAQLLGVAAGPQGPAVLQQALRQVLHLQQFALHLPVVLPLTQHMS